MARATKTVELKRPFVSNPHPTNLASEILTSLRYRIGKDATVATPHDWLAASISVVRDRVIERWIEATKEALVRYVRQTRFCHPSPINCASDFHRYASSGGEESSRLQ